jgi:L-lysine exporter family protein LysE/ArgO
MTPSAMVFLEGFLLNAALIVGFGPQNTFLLRQSLTKQHLFVMVLLCVFLDAALMTLGTLGLSGWMRDQHLTKFITYAGAGFLLYYGLRSFRMAFRASSAFMETNLVPSRQNVMLSLLVASLLNPAKYLDTLLFVSGTAMNFGELRFVYVTGAIFASLVWFALLTYGSALLAPWLKSNVALRLLDVSTGSVLCFMAYRIFMFKEL